MNYPTGWIKPEDRTAEMHAADATARQGMRPRFALDGVQRIDPGPYVNLMDLWKHPSVIAALGFEFSGVHQLTGSCVGAGGGNAIFTLSAVEVILKNDPEQIILPFWLHPYGKSRELMGERSEGEGSLGSTFAQAVKQFGCFSQKEPGLPPYENNDGLTWGAKTELKWSNGTAIGSEWVTLGKKHLVKSTDPVKSSNDGKGSIKNLYPMTFACPWFMTPGQERVQGSKEPACVGSLSSNGGHQTSILAVWEHPELGLLFWNENQWGLKTYKTDPKTGRGSGCWMTERDFNKVAQNRDGEIFSLSQYDGYPSQSIDWSGIFS
jgi:hypothetical protein